MPPITQVRMIEMLYGLNKDGQKDGPDSVRACSTIPPPLCMCEGGAA